MKSNKLQYLQKLATNSNQKQAIIAISKKPVESPAKPNSNLVGIATNNQSKGMPYAAGPRKGAKNVKHQPQRNPVVVQETPSMSKSMPKKRANNHRDKSN